MQKEIYLDMATMHEAYIRDGLDGIHALAGPMELDAKTIQAWELIDAGKRTKDQSLIAEGTRLLALREQRTIIQDDYAVMYSRLTGPAITYLATMVGQPSVPGAKSFPEVFPLAIDPGGPARVPVKSPAVGPLPSFGVELPNPLHGHVEVVTPLADGNVAHFDDRWALFTKDTLPAYEDMSRDRRLEELNKPWNQRVDDYRFHNRIDDLAKQATRWDVRRKQ
jgi:hypothetical protein